MSWLRARRRTRVLAEGKAEEEWGAKVLALADARQREGIEAALACTEAQEDEEQTAPRDERQKARPGELQVAPEREPAA